jgi:4-hydroxy-3-polyprenylbenzoate decarboxylase
MDPHYSAVDFREACFYELADRLVPGLVTDVNIPFALRLSGGVIYQVTKRRPRDEGYQRNILMHALTAQPGIPLVIAVDEDVDIYSMDDVMWAIMGRTEPATDYLRGAPGSRGGAGGFGGGLAIDATVPFLEKGRFERAQFAVDKADLKKWFSEAEVSAIRAQQSEYAKCLAQRGW